MTTPSLSPWEYAASLFDETRMGRLVWVLGGLRCYQAGGEITIVGRGRPTLVHRYEGVDLDALS